MENNQRRQRPYRIVHRHGQQSKVRAIEFAEHLRLGNLIQTTDQREHDPRAAYVHPGLIAVRDVTKVLTFTVGLRVSVAEIVHRLINTFDYEESLAREVARAMIYRRDSQKKRPLNLGVNVWDLYIQHILATVDDPEREPPIINMRCLIGEPRIVGDPVVPGDPDIYLPDGKTKLPYGSRMVIW